MNIYALSYFAAKVNIIDLLYTIYITNIYYIYIYVYCISININKAVVYDIYDI